MHCDLIILLILHTYDIINKTDDIYWILNIRLASPLTVIHFVIYWHPDSIPTLI